MLKCKYAFIQFYFTNTSSKNNKSVTLRSRISSFICSVPVAIFRSLYVNMVGLWITVSLAMLSGLTMYSIYKDCDPFTNTDVSSSDQVKLIKL